MPKALEAPGSSIANVTHRRVQSASTDAEGQETGEHPVLPGLEGYSKAVARLRRGEMTYREFLNMMNAARPDFRERIHLFLETLLSGFYGMVARHHKR